MTDPVHRLVTPHEPDGASQLMPHMGQRGVPYVHRTYGRSGTLWAGRFRSCLVEAASSLLRCQRSLALNPVRAGMVPHPGASPWSSFPAHAPGEPHPLLTPHACSVALGQLEPERQWCYRAFWRDAMELGVIDALRLATNGGYWAGNASCKPEIADMLKRQGKYDQPG